MLTQLASQQIERPKLFDVTPAGLWLTLDTSCVFVHTEAHRAGMDHKKTVMHYETFSFYD